MVRNAIDYFNIDHALTIINRNEEGCEFAFFATTHDNLPIINTYLREAKTLRTFVDYFKNENSQLLKLNSEYKIDLKTLKKEAFFSKENILDIVTDNKVSSFDLKTINLSPREKDCLYYYLKGRTASFLSYG